MDKKLINNLKNLNKLNKERIFWLRISVFVVLMSVLTVLNWDYVISTNIIWILVSIGITITIVWWYWTMRIIRKLISFKTSEVELLNDLINDIRSLKKIR